MEVKMIDMGDIVANPLQPRRTFNKEKLQELANSIYESELLQPITVRPKGKKFEIVAGERRFKAFQILKEPKIPAIIRDIKDDTDALEKSLVENWHREDLTSMERENAVYDLWKSKRYDTHGDLAKKLGVSVSRINEIIAAINIRNEIKISDKVSTRSITDTAGLSDEPREKILKQVEKGKIEADKVREVVRKVKEIPDEEKQIEALDLYEQESDVTSEVLDEAVTRLKEEAEGTRPMELADGRTSDDKRLDIIKNNCSGVYSVSTNKVKMIRDEKTRKKAQTHKYYLQVLVVFLY